MKLLRKMSLTAKQAKELIYCGFVLKLVNYGSFETDEYEVYVVSKGN